MDDIFDRAEKHGKKLFLATPSGARPAWLACGYEETCRVDAKGRRTPWEVRHNHCWTSPVMHVKTKVINEKLAERYARRPALAGWHISNELNGECFCSLCLARFAEWLRGRYGTLEALNAAYWSAFWSHQITDWRQVNPRDWTSGIAHLDWMRFSTACLVDFLRFEIGAVRRFSDAPATANMMGFFGQVDYWRVAEACDFVSDDCYPFWTPARADAEGALYSMMHDMHYAMKGKPFVMMESCPGIPQWKPHPRMRRDGELEREALMALGHGSDAILYFQWRKGLGGHEKTHGAVVGHDGTDRTRVFRHVAELGARLGRAAGITDAAMAKPEVAVVYDWESNWALHATSGFGESARRITDIAADHYAAFWRASVPTAVIESLCDFSPYRVLVLPMLFMLKKGVAERLVQFVENGGTLAMTYLSAYVDGNNQCFRGGTPGGPLLRGLFGVWNEDIDGMAPEDRQGIRFADDSGGAGARYEVARMAEYIHAEGAETVGVFTDDLLAGRPALTGRSRGKGRAWYLAAEAGADFLDAFYARVRADAGVKPVLPDIPADVRGSRRSKDGTDYYFLLNLSDCERPVDLPFPMTDIWNGDGVKTRAILPPNGGTLLSARGDGKPA
jgi:beta-galactosidase